MEGARPEERVAEARERYLARNGLREEDYALSHFAVRVGRFTMRLPNPRARREVVAFHDLHHVATGFPTSWIGEIQVSAWEFGAGLGGHWVAWAICVPFFLAGLVLRPRLTWCAYRAGRAGRSLFASPAPLGALLALRVGELRERLGVPAQGLGVEGASTPR